MHVPLAEQETTINFSREDDTLVLWTSDTTVMTKIDKLEAWELVKAEKCDGQVMAKEYRAKKNMITFRSKQIVGRKLSEEEKREKAEFLRKLRESNK